MIVLCLILSVIYSTFAQIPVTLQQVEDAQKTGKYVCEINKKRPYVQCKYIGVPAYNVALNPQLKNTGLGSCVTASQCDSDFDCGAGAGTCNGLRAGTCNCAACINFKRCDADSDCGGLIGGCNRISQQCQCQKALEKLGFETLLEQNQKFCGVRKRALGCFGLPTNKGICSCPLRN